MSFLKSIDQFINDVFFPQDVFCLACGKPVLGRLLCDDCLARLEEAKLTPPLCPVCGHSITDDEPCSNCRSNASPYRPDRSRHVWHHIDVPRSLVVSLKHQHQPICAEPLLDALAEAAREAFVLPGDSTIVTSVTMPEKRLEERGIDHGRILAEAVASRLSLNYQRLLSRTVDQLHTQQGLSGEERRINLENTFACAEDLEGKTILLVDDVSTTGATAQACCRVFKEAGAKQIYFLSATLASD